MATIRKRQLKNGMAFDVQVKVKDPVTNKTIIKSTSWKPDPHMTKKQQETEVALFAEKFEKQIKGMYTGSIAEVPDYNITFSKYAEKWLERVRHDYSIAYYEMSLQIVRWIDRYLGNMRIRDITPLQLQDFFDRVDQEKKIMLTVHAKERLKVVMAEKGIRFKDFRDKYKLNAGTLSNVMSGKTVSLAYAEQMARILDVEPDEVFQIDKKEELYSPSTTARVKRTTRCIFAMAKRQRLVEQNFASADYVSYGRKAQRDIKCLDDEQAKRFFGVIMEYEDIRAKTAILTVLLTGMRRGEVSGLEWKDIDFERKTISILRTSNYSRLQGIYTKEPKTAGSVRKITVSGVLIRQLQEYKTWYDQMRENWGDRWVETDRLFIQEDGKAIAPSTINFWLKKMLKEAGLERVTLHSLRHTNITLQIAAGVPLRTVSGRAGHSRTSTTTDIYSHFIQSSDEAAANVLNQIFTGENNE